MRTTNPVESTFATTGAASAHAHCRMARDIHERAAVYVYPCVPVPINPSYVDTG